jgi:hypothetical protein
MSEPSATMTFSVAEVEMLIDALGLMQNETNMSDADLRTWWRLLDKLTLARRVMPDGAG